MSDSDWGSAGISEFVHTEHSKPYPAIDPTKVQFPNPYVVCILGASRGIGAKIAHAYVQAGASGIILSSRRVSALKEVAAECKAISPDIKVEVIPCDIVSSGDCANLAEKIKTNFGRLDNVIVNSGYSGPVNLKVDQDDPDVVRRVTEITYLGTYNVAHFLIPLLIASAPSPGTAKAFLAVGSIAAFLVRGPIANTQYCVAKIAQLKLIEHLHEQYKDQRLLTAAIHPGAVMSEMAEETAPKEFMKYLIDDPALCGAFMVWLTKPREAGGLGWLGGRHLVANWDVDELLGRQHDIVEKDLLKAKLTL